MIFKLEDGYGRTGHAIDNLIFFVNAPYSFQAIGEKTILNLIIFQVLPFLRCQNVTLTAIDLI